MSFLASGSVVFGNLLSRTILFSVSGPDGDFGSAGVVPAAGSTFTIKVISIGAASTVDNKDFASGTDGWETAAAELVEVVPHEENVGPGSSVRRLQLDQDLLLGTTVEGESSASYTFTSSEDACFARVRYRFVTSEVPGGYFGSMYNDYFSVSISSKDGGTTAFETSSMNALGLAAFNAQTGSTSWRDVYLELDPGLFSGTDTVQVDLVVANVGDGLLDSQVYVDFVEEIFEYTTAGGSDDACACAACQKWYDAEIKVSFFNPFCAAPSVASTTHSLTRVFP